jgi:hypothetical protein
MYPPKDTDHAAIYSPPEGQNILAYVLQSLSPQLVDLVLSNHLASTQDIKEAWEWAVSEGFMTDIRKDGTSVIENGNFQDVLALLMRYGGFTFPSTTDSASADAESAAESNNISFEASTKLPDWHAPGGHAKGRGRGRDRGKNQGRAGARGGRCSRDYRGRGSS